MSLKNTLICLLATFAVLCSCSRGARIDGRLEGASAGIVTARFLDGTTLRTVDSVKVSSSGTYSFDLPVSDGQPEFAYLSYGGRQLASLIVKKGDRVKVETDTLGNLLSLGGSPESALLYKADSTYKAFAVRFQSLQGVEQTKEYVGFYRSSVAFVMQHSRSLSVVPVLLRKVSPELPVFGQETDGLIFSNVADSLAEVYPDSRYVRSLRREADRRRNALELSHRLASANEAAFPEIELPDTRAQNVKLSEVEAPLVMLYFWATSSEEKMFNLDALMPLYNDFHAKGLEIFAVALDPDKAEWAATVKRQHLPWINVCDTRGAASPFIGLYGIEKVPTAYFIKDGQIDPDARVSDAASIRSYVSRVLR